MKHDRPTRPASATPTHEFLVLCVRPDALPSSEPNADFPAERVTRRTLADVDGMFWCPARLSNDAA